MDCLQGVYILYTPPVDNPGVNLCIKSSWIMNIIIFALATPIALKPMLAGTCTRFRSKSASVILQY